jgi:hypothetical protein
VSHPLQAGPGAGRPWNHTGPVYYSIVEVMGYRWRRRKHKLRMRARIFKICQGDVVQAKMEHETRVVRVVQEEKRFNECAVNAGAVRSHTPVQSD